MQLAHQGAEVTAHTGPMPVPASVDPLRLRRVLGRHDLIVPQPYGSDGWVVWRYDRSASVIVGCSLFPGDEPFELVHASIAHPDSMPTYEELTMLHRAVWGDGWAYQVFAPPSEHINIHEYALHLWGRLDGRPMLPDFTLGLGSI